MARAALVRADRYSWRAIWLHWSIAVPVLVNLALGLFPVPPLPISGATAKLGHDAHGLLGYVMLALAVPHIAAALPPFAAARRRARTDGAGIDPEWLKFSIENVQGLVLKR